VLYAGDLTGFVLEVVYLAGIDREECVVPGSADGFEAKHQFGSRGEIAGSPQPPAHNWQFEPANFAHDVPGRFLCFGFRVATAGGLAAGASNPSGAAALCMVSAEHPQCSKNAGAVRRFAYLRTDDDDRLPCNALSLCASWESSRAGARKLWPRSIGSIRHLSPPKSFGGPRKRPQPFHRARRMIGLRVGWG
jgi:hypothetical protein